jgi:hypothetical protein
MDWTRPDAPSVQTGAPETDRPILPAAGPYHPVVASPKVSGGAAAVPAASAMSSKLSRLTKSIQVVPLKTISAASSVR